ncbi:transketolase [Pseudolactococcus reticulitermitis]|uniref:Transketolase N-terminal subunit n=1 Tax=Pseudolactococcus reticulitermitis TaxID=2025039 RepID=A0A224XAY9_9LACT|nr:transketolase [Lactococcus reticulitermitis]GAX46885.1 transketolase N-terminal subunit [Lactococcus reticulitermitis]
MNIEELREKSIELRKNIIQMVFNAESGHFGGSLSSIDLINYIYEEYILKSNDVFILSKGHSAPALYAKLAQSKIISKELLTTFRSNGSTLTGHPSSTIPGISFGLGSLGQGASIGVGVALALKLKNIDRKVFVLLGDGELNEGQVWEAMYSSKSLNLSNLVFVVDQNCMQLDGFCDKVSKFDNLKCKFKSFLGVDPIEIDGNDYDEIQYAFSRLKCNTPQVVLAKTIKGKGVHFMENNPDFHSYRVNKEEKIYLFEEANKCLNKMEGNKRENYSN